jgi:signal transduction histidine kinase
MKHSLLVVDDEQQVLDSIYDLFRREFTVLRATSAAEAKDILRNESVHIVMSDQRMPDVTGVELLCDIRQEYPDTVRLIFTAYADLQVVVRAINQGQVFRYVEKGSGPDELRSVLRQAADYYDLRADRKRLITELQRANEDLRKANALKAAFLDVASHELNTPVTIIMGMSELAQERVAQPDGKPFRSFVNVVQSGAKRLDHIVGSMLKLLQAGSFESGVDRDTFEIKQMLDAVHTEVAPFISKRGQTLRIVLDPPDAVLHADRGKLHDVIWNLVMNAIKFSPDGAIIEVSARTGDRGSQVFEVSDAGVGISDVDRPHIFEPFFSTFDMMHHSSGSFEYGKRGLGMGLAIVKKFVAMHGGTVRVEPRHPRGSSFIVEIPSESESCSTSSEGVLQAWGL